MPRTVRVGVSLIAFALTLDVIGTFWFKGVSVNAITQVLILILLFGGLLLAIAHRRNWARLIFASLFVIALPFSLVAMSRAAATSPTRVVLSAILAGMQALGLAFLFLPEASAWYHGRDRAA